MEVADAEISALRPVGFGGQVGYNVLLIEDLEHKRNVVAV